jgi:hypothetical protein
MLLLLAFAIGSILARDAVLAQRVHEIRAAAQGIDLTIGATFASVQSHRRAELKVRPSGLSKRAAWSPTDPPDDEDETDDDSDTLAISRLRALPVDVPALVEDACCTDAREIPSDYDVLRSSQAVQDPRVRGPPSPAVVLT